MTHLTSTDWKHSGLQAVCPTASTGLQHTLMLASQSTKVFGELFQSETYTNPFFPQQEENFLFLNDPTIARGYVTAFRGFAKTTSLKTQILADICFRRMRFGLYCSRTQDYAITQTNSIKSALIAKGSAIKEVFRPQKPESYGGDNPAFSAAAWFLSFVGDDSPWAFMTPKGSEQQVNGALVSLNGREYRPDRLWVDDGEDRTLIQNEENRRSYERWLYEALLECVSIDRPNAWTHRWKRDEKNPHWRPPWRVWYQDTIKHPDSAMQRIVESEEWIGNVYPIAEEIEGESADDPVTYRSLIPEILSDEQITREARKAESRQGGLDGWYRERMCKSKASVGDNFNKGMLQYYKDDIRCNAFPAADKFIIVDPAKTANPKSCYSGIGAYALDVFDSKVFTRRAQMVKMHTHELANFAFDMCIETRTRNLFIEDTGGEEQYIYIFENEASKRGLREFITLHRIDARRVTPAGDFGVTKNKAKVARGTLLLPLYVGRYMYHHESLRNGPLEAQILNFPDCVIWDLFDAHAYVPEVLRRGGRFFPHKDDETAKSQFEEFDAEDAAWRELVESECWKVAI